MHEISGDLGISDLSPRRNFMSKSSVNINYHGFHPSDETKHFVAAVIHEIQEELPGGATVKASFSKNKDIVKGILQIGSYAGPFFSVAASHNLKDVTFKLLEQMRRRLEKWKYKRRRGARHMNQRAAQHIAERKDSKIQYLMEEFIGTGFA
jgi:hypothetical protein